MDIPVWTYLFILLSYGIRVNTQSPGNIVFNKPTVQDGVLHYPYDNPSAFWLSRNAVDGRKDCPSNADYTHYSGTAEKDMPWWQVDLGNVFSVTNITVYGRPTEMPLQLKGFIVHLSEINQTSSENVVYNNTEAYGNGTFKDIIANGKVYYARYITIVLPKSDHREQDGPLVLCEVEVFGEPIPKSNIALHKPTVQDGVLHYPVNDPSALWLSSNAVDGRKVCPSNADYTHYSGTSVKDVPWWQVDLGNVFSVKNIIVYGRPTELPPQLKGFIVQLSLVNQTSSANVVYNNTEAYGNGIFKDIIASGKVYNARYITIVLPKTDGRFLDGPLVMCEVEVYGVPIPKSDFSFL